MQGGRPIDRPGRITFVAIGEFGDMSVPTDEDLLFALRGGHAESLGVLVARWEGPLFRFVSRLVDRPDDARDVCQETFLRILDKAEAFRDGARFSTWMYQIALNLCRDQTRRKHRWGRLMIGAPASAVDAPRDYPAPETAATNPVAALEHTERRSAVRRALSALPREQREVLLLKEYEGLKFREIADVLGVAESTVKSRMYAGLDAMRMSLASLGIQ